jgi:hypothetical protein
MYRSPQGFLLLQQIRLSRCASGAAHPASPDFANPLVNAPADVNILLGEIDNEASSSA